MQVDYLFPEFLDRAYVSVRATPSDGDKATIDDAELTWTKVHELLGGNLSAHGPARAPRGQLVDPASGALLP